MTQNFTIDMASLPKGVSLEQVLQIITALKPLPPKRATGRTTRLADAAIQYFFKNGTVIVADHREDVDPSLYHINDLALTEIVCNRLKREHNIFHIERTISDAGIKLKLMGEK